MHRPQEEIGKAFNQAPDSLHMLARRHALVLSSAAFSNRDLLNSCTTGASHFFCERDSGGVKGGCECHFDYAERAASISG